MGAIQPWHLVLVLIVVLIVFGPGKLPDIGKALGQSMREFRDATKGMGDLVTPSDQPAPPPPPAAPPAAPTAQQSAITQPPSGGGPAQQP